MQIQRVQKQMKKKLDDSEENLDNPLSDSAVESPPQHSKDYELNLKNERMRAIEAVRNSVFNADCAIKSVCTLLDEGTVYTAAGWSAQRAKELASSYSLNGISKEINDYDTIGNMLVLTQLVAEKSAEIEQSGKSLLTKVKNRINLAKKLNNRIERVNKSLKSDVTTEILISMSKSLEKIVECLKDISKKIPILKAEKTEAKDKTKKIWEELKKLEISDTSLRFMMSSDIPELKDDFSNFTPFMHTISEKLIKSISNLLEKSDSKLLSELKNLSEKTKELLESIFKQLEFLPSDSEVEQMKTKTNDQIKEIKGLIAIIKTKLSVSTDGK